MSGTKLRQRRKIESISARAIVNALVFPFDEGEVQP
jgi:hypothetical protein